MRSKSDIDKVIKIIKEHKESPNKDLIFAMDFIKEDFELTKDSLIKLTHHLDKLELNYNLLLKEYQNRNNINE
jgi:hypothetical protein